MIRGEPTDDQVRRVAELLMAEPDAAACAACLDDLEAYMSAQLAGEAYQSLFPAVALHLDSCLACAASYALLYEARRSAESAPEAERLPEPDLSFLEPGAAGPLTPRDLRERRRMAQLGARLAAAIETIGSRLRLTLRQALLDLVAPAGPALALRAGAPGSTPLASFQLDTPAAAVETLQIAIYDEGGGLRAVRVMVALEGRAWPDLAGIPVTLTAEGQQRRNQTDAWGEALFEGLPEAALGELQIEVDAGDTPPTST